MLAGLICRCRLCRFRPLRSLVDPGSQQRHLSRRQSLPTEGHVESIIFTGHQMDQPAAGAVSRLNYRPRVAAAKGVRLVVQPQTALLHLLTVAGVALPFQKGLNLAAEIDLSLERRRRAGGPTFLFSGYGRLSRQCCGEKGEHANQAQSRGPPQALFARSWGDHRQ